LAANQAGRATTIARPRVYTSSEIGFAYLEASWQVEKDVERNRLLLETSRKWFETYLTKAPQEDESRTSAEFLRGELLRRVGKFPEAKEQFARMSKLKEFEGEPFPAMIRQEMSLIEGKDSSPQPINRDKVRSATSPLRVVRPQNRWSPFAPEMATNDSAGLVSRHHAPRDASHAERDYLARLRRAKW
jgi:hypothetical protein